MSNQPVAPQEDIDRRVEPDGLPGSLTRAWAVLRARIWMLLLVSGGCFVFVAVGTYARAPRYESTAKLMVQLDARAVAL